LGAKQTGGGRGGVAHRAKVARVNTKKDGGGVEKGAGSGKKTYSVLPGKVRGGGKIAETRTKKKKKKKNKFSQKQLGGGGLVFGGLFFVFLGFWGGGLMHVFLVGVFLWGVWGWFFVGGRTNLWGPRSKKPRPVSGRGKASFPLRGSHFHPNPPLVKQIFKCGDKKT